MKLSDITKENYLEIAKRTQEKMKETHKNYNNYVTICDISSQLSQLEGKEDAPLFGVCIAVKDNFNTEGIITTASSRILNNYVPIYDATVIKKLKAAGAIIAAKTSMDELGMGGTNLNAFTGRTFNPYAHDKITGGSSGGSAVAVTNGDVAVALGTDTGDSIRKPAHYCGLVGLKPTYGRVSRYGVIPYASSLDHVGFFTTTVKDSAKMLEICAGRDDLDATSLFDEVEKYTALNADVKGKKIAILKNVQDTIDDEEMLSKFKALVQHLQEKGAIVEEVTFDNQLMHALLPTYLIIANAEASANHANLDGIKYGMQEDGDSLEEIMINTRTKGFSKQVRTRFLMGAYSLDSDNQERIFRKAQKVRRKIVDELMQCLSNYDAILRLAASSTAPDIDMLERQEALSSKYLIAENSMLLGNFSGCPSLSLPIDIKDNLPFGVAIITNAKDEKSLFEIGLEIEEFSGLSGLVKGE